eukprot:scaffold109499_cov15-Prasinocladus_malaysianus.AAC.1
MATSSANSTCREKEHDATELKSDAKAVDLPLISPRLDRTSSSAASGLPFGVEGLAFGVDAFARGVAAFALEVVASCIVGAELAGTSTCKMHRDRSDEPMPQTKKLSTTNTATGSAP